MLFRSNVADAFPHAAFQHALASSRRVRGRPHAGVLAAARQQLVMAVQLRDPFLGAVQAQGRHAAERVPSDLGDAEMGDACTSRLAWLAIRVII